MAVTVTSTIDIAATPEEVWGALVDFPSYAREGWNPFVRAIEGRPVVGEKLVVRLAGVAGRGMSFRPRLLVAEAARELRWIGRLGFGGLFDGEHFFVLTEAATGHTRLVHGETFSGILVAMMRSTTDAGGEGFEAFNLALKARAESIAAAR